MRIEEHVLIGAPAADVWAQISDPQALGQLDAGVIVEADRPGEPPGLRSRYRAMLRVGPVPVGGDVEIVEFVPGRELAWTSLTGIDQRFRLRVRATDDGRTRLTLRFGYTSPGALGVLADLVAFGQVRSLLRGLLRAVTAETEQRARSRRRQARPATKATAAGAGKPRRAAAKKTRSAAAKKPPSAAAKKPPSAAAKKPPSAAAKKPPSAAPAKPRRQPGRGSQTPG